MDTECNAGFPATVLIGSQRDFDYNAFTKLRVVDEAALQTFFGLFQQPDNTAHIAADEEQFLDRSRSKLLVDPRGIKSVETIRITGLRGYITEI